MSTISPAELQQKLSANPQLPLIDVRTPVEYSAVHVPSAHNTPLDALNPKALLSAGQIPATEPFYILCQSGARAAKAAAQFASAGIMNSVVVTGGTQAWEQAGFPVTKGRAAISLERQVRIAAGSLVVTGVVLSFAVHPYFIGLSAFVGAGLVFAGITDWCGMGLLIAKAPWNQTKAP